jgi:Ca2+-binding EF-hand superfamily protein
MTKFNTLLSITLITAAVAGCEHYDGVDPVDTRDASMSLAATEGEPETYDADVEVASKGESCEKGSVEEHVAATLASLDADGGGTLSAAEANETWLSTMFPKADANEDGALTQGELIAYKTELHADDGVTAEVIEQHVAKMYSGLDLDQDGSLSIKEARQTWLSARFAEADGSRDGVLSQSELVAYKKTLHVDDGVTAEVIEEHVANTFKSLDADGDGSLTLEESEQTSLHAGFARVDADGDGQLSHQELVDIKLASASKAGTCG